MNDSNGSLLDSEGELVELSIVEKIIGVFVSPVSTFKYLAMKPDFWSAFLVVSLASIALAMLTIPEMIPLVINSTVEQIEQMPGMSDYEKQQTLETLRKVIPISLYVSAVVNPVVQLVINWIIVSVFVFFVSIIQGLQADFKRLFGMIPWTSLVCIFTQAITTFIISNTDLDSLKQMFDVRLMKPFSLIAAIPKTLEIPAFLAGVLGTVDPFYVWRAILLVIVFQYANRCSKAQAVATSLIFVPFSLLAAGAYNYMNTMMTGGVN